MIATFMSGIAIMSIDEKSTRRNELDRAVSNATWQTVAISKPSGTEEIKSNDEMMNEFIEKLFIGINSDADIKIDFMAVDYEEGLLDVKVTERFKTPNGNEQEIIIRKTAIYE